MRKNTILAVFSAIIAGAAALVSCNRVTTPEVNYKLYLDWPERYLPDFSTLGEPDMQGVKINIDLEDLPDTLNHYAVLFETTLKVAKAEEYTFELTSDDGTKFYVDGEMLIENDGAHGPIFKTVTKELSKGAHDLRLEFFDYDKGQLLFFEYFTPTIAKRQFNDQLKKIEDELTSDDGFVMPQIEEAAARYKAWKGDDETVTFPILTDIHTAGRFSYKHVGYAARGAEAFGYDFMTLLGDIGLNAFPATQDSLYADSVIANTRAGMDEYDGVYLYAAGNHDWDGGAGRHLNQEFLSETFQKPWLERAGGNLHLVPGKVYGWYDVPGKDFRVIFLNSQGTETIDKYYYFDPEQLDWLDSLLAETPATTTVLILVHYTPVHIGRWTTTHPELHTLDANEKLMALLTKHSAKGNLTGLFSGDSHTNFLEIHDGVNYYTTQGYGWVSPDLMLPGTTHAFFDYRQMMCVDVVSVKPAKREVASFRIGAGGKDYDVVFNY